MKCNFYKKVSLLTSAILLICAVSAYSQGVGINTTNAAPHPSAGLDVDFTDRGMLMPRMTQAQRDNIQSPATGLQIYNTDTDCINMWTGTGWKKACFDCDFNLPLVSNNGPVCEGSSLNLSCTAVSGATYAWTGPDGFSSSSQNPVISNVTLTTQVYIWSLLLSTVALLNPS